MGFLFIERDDDGKYSKCLNCGFYNDLYFHKGVPTTKPTSNGIAVQPTSKWGLNYTDKREEG